jgi:type II secretory pathway pseudopilin PulG
MAALLIAMSVMAIMMTVVMPVWKQAAQREKEEELVFRGKQYVHAIGLFQRKFANAYPPNVDVLVEQRFLRKKFKDPITNDDFVPLGAGQAPAGVGQQQPGPPGRGAQGTAARTPSPATTTAQQPGGAGRGSTSPAGSSTPGGIAGGVGGSIGGTGGTTAGVSGVTSKSKDQSIRLYNGRGHYNEWAFIYMPQTQQPGCVPGSAVPGQSTQPGQQRGQPPGQRGQPNPFDPGAQRGRGSFNPGGANTPPPPPLGGRGFGPGQQPLQPRGRE